MRFTLIPENLFPMKKNISLILVFVLLFISCMQNSESRESSKEQNLPASALSKVMNNLLADADAAHQFRLERGLNQVADLWHKQDGDIDDFKNFCQENFITDSQELELLFLRLQDNFEVLHGMMNEIDVRLKEPVQLTGRESTPVDLIFAGYDVSAHLTDDFYKNKIAFITALNFPAYSLNEKTELGAGWSRKEWAFARMGDRFTERVPASLVQNSARILSDADNYISNYNIYMGHLLNDAGEKLFPEGMKLITHWGLRDELKSNYADSLRGFEKQEMVYRVMQRIIDQTIPLEVINSGDYDWNPFQNTIIREGMEQPGTPESELRYQVLQSNFFAELEVDKYLGEGSTAIRRNFEQQMEIPLEDIREIFRSMLSSQQVNEVASLIQSRLGRELRPYDIWYDGFKGRGAISEDYLDRLTGAKYPNPAALERDLSNILVKLGWPTNKATEIASLIQVDPSIGAGHAWGSAMKGSKSHLRTRIGEAGMDYKGYNIAVHEFGHNVEQTITMNDVDYWMLSGVPNNAFTEAAAFLFQKQDLKLLGFHQNNSNSDAMLTLDTFWNACEIMGVALVDIAVWEWMYNNPKASPAQLKEAVIAEAQKVWNEFFAGILGDKDETILAVYSHMIDYPLYLAYYPVGHLIAFQLEQQMKGKNFAAEFERIFTQGRVVPQLWMKNAVGSTLSEKPLLTAVDEALKTAR